MSLISPENEPADFPFAPGPDGQLPPEYAQRQATDPLGSVRMPSRETVILATRYDDVRAILSDPRFSRYLPNPDTGQPLGPTDTVGTDDWFLNLDPPEHARLRRIVSKAFTPQQLERWRPRIRQIAADLLNELTQSPARADLIVGYALPLPARTIHELLGIPQIDRTHSPAWSLPPGPRRFETYVAEIIAARRHQPAQGLLNNLIEAHHEGKQLDDIELNKMVRMLLRTGTATISTTIGRGVYALLRHPEQFTAICSDPTLLSNAVEEILRLELPGDGSTIRVATENIELPSGNVQKGMGVLPIISAANRDERHFELPNNLDIRRTHNQHIAFGCGPHHCLGAHLARMELQEAIGSLAERLPTLRLAIDPEQITWTSGISHGIRHLPVSW
ncbi:MULTISPECIES: cytochrome P450 [unclassified Nocardia]|uniref:cytochrome P450 n=1 Tax=unclassified Nocardia TaxID=2637762 RepID=UPI001CE45655|nr:MULTISPECIES: cytochrome P450 [unclassified Nocardia]